MAEAITNAEDRTVRLGLPLLYPGQAHKEAAHNEALTRLDLMVNMVAEQLISSPDSLTPENGQCWIVGGDATGVWADKRQYIAAFVDNGWVYFPPREGQLVFIMATRAYMVFRFGQWRFTGQFTQPGGGAVVDEEARSAIQEIQNALHIFGLLVPSLGPT